MPLVCYNTEKILSNLLVGFLFVLVIVLIWTCKSNESSKAQPYLDYMPAVTQPCPSHYTCGASSKSQVKMENDLYDRLRESEKYSTPDLLNTDQCCVNAKESEPTSCMLKRSLNSNEPPLPEGMAVPEDDFEVAFLTSSRR